MSHTIRDNVVSKIKEYNPDADMSRYDEVFKYCDILENDSNVYIDVFNCVVNSDDMINFKVGVYYAEINLEDGEPFMDIMSKAESAKIYPADVRNPEGAIFVVSMDFRVGE